MSAFPESGRSNTPKTAETKVRFRPEAEVRVVRIIEITPGKRPQTTFGEAAFAFRGRRFRRTNRLATMRAGDELT